MSKILNIDGAEAYALRPSQSHAAQRLLDGLEKRWWSEKEPNYAADLKQWNVPSTNYQNSSLTPSDKHIVTKMMAFLATADTIVELSLAQVAGKIASTDWRAYLLKQAAQEGIHTKSYAMTIDTLGIGDGAFSDYKSIPQIRAKVDFLSSFLGASELDLTKPTDRQKFVMQLAIFFLCAEGIGFDGSFVIVSDFRRRNLLEGTAKSIEWIQRDEDIHVAAGTSLIKELAQVYPEVLNSHMRDTIRGHVIEFVKLETAFVQYLMPDNNVPMSLKGLRASDVVLHIHYQADKRLKNLGIETVYNDGRLIDYVGRNKETNFFEGTVTEYQKDALSWDDDTPLGNPNTNNDTECEVCQ